MQQKTTDMDSLIDLLITGIPGKYVPIVSMGLVCQRCHVDVDHQGLNKYVRW
jgi:hypothetical protein